MIEHPLHIFFELVNGPHPSSLEFLGGGLHLADTVIENLLSTLH